jgi:hypothetical protein
MSARSLLPLDSESLAREFDDDVEALTGTLREAVDQQKTADLSVVAKQKAIEDYDAAFIPIARALEAAFRMAGETELADRIRPTIRRLTRPTEDDVPPPGGLDPPPSEESTEDSAAPGDGSPAENSAEPASTPDRGLGG